MKVVRPVSSRSRLRFSSSVARSTSKELHPSPNEIVHEVLPRSAPDTPTHLSSASLTSSLMVASGKYHVNTKDSLTQWLTARFLRVIRSANIGPDAARSVP